MEENDLFIPLNSKKVMLRLWHTASDQHVKFAVVAVSVFFYTIAMVIAPLYSAHIVDLMWEKFKSTPEGFAITWNCLGAEILILFLIYAAAGVFYAVQNFAMASFSERLNLRLRIKLSEKMNRLPLAYFDRNQPGKFISRITSDLDKMSESLQTGLLKLMSAVGTIIGSLIMMLYFNAVLTAVFLIFVWISVALTDMFSRRTLKYAVERQESISELTAFVEEAYSGRDIIKAFNKEEESLQKMHQKADEAAEKSKMADFIINGINPAVHLVTRIGQIIIAVTAGKMLVGGRITVGAFQAFFQYVGQVSEPLTEASFMINSMQSAFASAERIFEILDENEMEEDSDISEAVTNAKGNISFENIKFGYSEGKQLINNVSFEVKQGQKIAVVGATGAGKTTLINLLMRFYELSGGSILLDGVNIREISRNSLRKNFGMVLQDTWVFEGTVAENIAYGRPDASREDIIKAAKMARIDFFIRIMPNGYDTILSNDSENISAGQKQLLTIARVMLCNPSVLILDEATSNVDTRTEMEIGRAMDNLMKNRTSFVIAHRLSTIVDADLILVMKDGTVVEKGNHKSLLSRNGVYAELYNS